MDNATKAVEPTKTTDVAANKEQVSGLVDLSNFSNMPDLEKAEVKPVDLTVDYWTPEKDGEERRCVFSHIENREVEDEDTGETKILPTAFFFAKKDGKVVTFCNASKRLLGVFENGKIPRGFACLITYQGKKKNSTNNFSSDSWTVNPLTV